MSKQTAVEWLFEQIVNRTDRMYFLKELDQAKQMEEEQQKQIIKDYFEWHKTTGFVSHKSEDIEQYYKETFKLE